MQTVAEGKEIKKFTQRQKIAIYAAVTLFLVVAAVEVSILPRGSQLQQCNSILFTANRYACLENLAFSTANASICSFMPGLYKAQCLSNIAEKLGNPEDCYLAMSINATYGSTCIQYIANKTGSLSLCYSESAPYAQGCVFTMATKLNNASACASLTNVTMSEECASIVGIDEAVINTDPSYCGSVANTTNNSIIRYVMDNLNYVNMSKYASLQEMTIYSISMPGQGYNLKDLCYAVLADTSGNYSYCSYASTAGAAMCRSLKSAGQQTTSATNYTAALEGCASLGAEQGICIQTVKLSEAVATKNASICYTLGNSTQIGESCLAAIARQYKNESYCSMIQNKSAASACIMSLHYNSSS